MSGCSKRPPGIFMILFSLAVCVTILISRCVMWICQVALVLTQVAFALGAVYYKYNIVNYGLSAEDFNPIVFAFVREVVAGTIMCSLAYFYAGAVPKRNDLMKFVPLGLLLYCNQLFYILGVGLAGVVMATCMQPGIPVFTVAFAVLKKEETASLWKMVGILLASFGAVCMVFGGPSEEQGDTLNAQNSVYMGNILLLLNVLAMSYYYVLTKPLLTVYPPIAVAAWAYAVAACCMGLTAVLVADYHPAGWRLPPPILGPLAYWTLISSVTGYYIIAWSIKYLPPSQVAGFQCLQPVVGATMGFTLLGEQPTWWDLGGIGVIAGLIIVNSDSASQNTTTAQKLPASCANRDQLPP